MEPSPSPPTCPGELIFPDGSSRPLASPLTLVGRADGCDVRLDGARVRPWHCALAVTPSGALLRDLARDGSTRVNGTAVSTAPLSDGDRVGVGPTEFVVRLRAFGERAAVRVQAAAVAAQQAALTEEEGRLNQRRVSLERQEQQLAAHMGKRRRRLLAMQQRVRDGHAALEKDRAAYERRAAAGREADEQARRDLEAAREQVRAERRRLADLHRRMRRRWHRNWHAQRAALHGERGELAKAAEAQRREREALAQARLRHNGEVELGRRQIRDGWEQLRRAEREWEKRRRSQDEELARRAKVLDQRAAGLARAEQELERQRHEGAAARARLEQEVAGLENRARHLRLKVLDPAREARPEPAALPAVEPRPARPAPAALRQRLAEVGRFAEDLEDRRRHLRELAERLLLAWDRWRQEHASAAEALEGAAGELAERERQLAGRERALGDAESGLRRRREETATVGARLNAWQARLTAAEAVWRAERDGLLARVRALDEADARRARALTDLRSHWDERRRQEAERWRAAIGRCLEAGRRHEAAWEEHTRRTADLERQQRAVAERELALEQYRLECVGRADDSAAAEKRLEKLRRRWASLGGAARKRLERERQALAAEAAEIRRQEEQVRQDGAALATREAEWSNQQADREHQDGLAREARARLEREAAGLRAQREQMEGQLQTLRDEVERIARLMLGDDEPRTETTAQAA